MRKNVTELYRFLLTSVLAGVVSLALANVGYAFPSQSNTNCSDCHGTEDGAVDVSPDPLSLLRGEDGEVTFDVTDLPDTPAYLSVTGLNDADLAATVGGDWTAGGGDNYILPVDATGAFALPISTSGASVLGDYEIGVFLAGTGLWSTSTSFVVQTLIPEPASIALVSIVGGVFAVSWITRRRRKTA